MCEDRYVATHPDGQMIQIRMNLWALVCYFGAHQIFATPCLKSSWEPPRTKNVRQMGGVQENITHKNGKQRLTRQVATAKKSNQKLGSSQTWLCQTWLFAVFTQKRSFALFCTLLRSFADLHSRSFALICTLLRAFTCFCVRPHLERPRLGTAEKHSKRQSRIRRRARGKAAVERGQCSSPRDTPCASPPVEVQITHGPLLKDCGRRLLGRSGCVCLETGIGGGGQISENWREGWKIRIFRGPWNWPLYTEIL